MVYDEGFEIFLQKMEENVDDMKEKGNDYNLKVKENLFAFSKYSINKDYTPKDDDDEKSEGYVSDCS